MDEEVYDHIELFCESFIEQNSPKDGDMFLNVELVGTSRDGRYKAIFDFRFFRNDFIYEVSSINSYSSELLDGVCWN